MHWASRWAFGNRRQSIEWAVTVAILAFVYLLLPSPEPVMVDGREVSLFTLGGWLIPKGLHLLIALAALSLVYGLVWYVGRLFWPEATIDEMDDQPWEGTPKTTAEEFLTAEPSWGRCWDTDENDDMAELVCFLDAQTRWLQSAPEETLRDLVPACERLSLGSSALSAEALVARVIEASEIRGIPTREEIDRLIERIESRGQ